MNKEQAKKLLPIIQAYTEGKEIEIKPKEGSRWCKFEDDDIHYLEFEKYDFRIKPEPKYRPFKDAEECWQEMLKHSPFGWLKGSENNRFVISAIRNEGVCINGGKYCSYYNSVFNKYQFADGTPFGIMEN